MRLYFAHPYKTRGMNGEESIMEIAREKGHEILNPFDGEDSILEEHGVKEYYGNVKKAVAFSFFERDLDLLRSCDGVLAWIPLGIGQPIGTPCELMYGWMLSKYLIVISKIPSPFFIYMENEFYKTINDYDYDRKWVIN